MFLGAWFYLSGLGYVMSLMMTPRNSQMAAIITVVIMALLSGKSLRVCRVYVSITLVLILSRNGACTATNDKWRFIKYYSFFWPNVHVKSVSQVVTGLLPRAMLEQNCSCWLGQPLVHVGHFNHVHADQFNVVHAGQLNLVHADQFNLLFMLTISTMFIS